MKIASSSGSPTERSSCCWVPSPQSNRMRSPPARSSSAGRPRRAVGTEPAVPAKKSERSMVRASLERAAARSATRPSSTVGDPHRVRGRAAALGRRAGVEDLEAVGVLLVQRAGASGRRRRRRRPGSAPRMRASRPGRGPASWTMPIRAPPQLDHAGRRQQRAAAPSSSTLPWTAVHRRPEPLAAARSTSARMKSPACRIASAARSSATQRGRQRARAARHVGVGDDREAHGPQR